MIKEETRKVHRKPGRNKGGLRKLWGTPLAAQRRGPGGLLGDSGLCRPAALGALGVLRWLLQSTTEDRLERLKECFKRSD